MKRYSATVAQENTIFQKNNVMYFLGTIYCICV